MSKLARSKRIITDKRLKRTEEYALDRLCGANDHYKDNLWGPILDTVQDLRADLLWGEMSDAEFLNWNLEGSEP